MEYFDIKIDAARLDPRFEVRVAADGVPVVAAKKEVWAVAAPRPAAGGAGSGGGADEAASGGGGAAAAAKKRREQTRLIAESGGRIEETGKIGGAFAVARDPTFVRERVALFERLFAEQQERARALPHEAIRIQLPDGSVKEGVSFETTPLDVANMISKSLAKKVVVAMVGYTRRMGEDLDSKIVSVDEEDEEAAEAAAAAAALLGVGAAAGDAAPAGPKLSVWDLTRPLEGDCVLHLKTFEDDEGRTTFWHSSAHVLGQAIEQEFGAKLCYGPPTEGGFYYDAYMGEASVDPAQFEALDHWAENFAKEKQPFQRLVLRKDQALAMFADNPFKQQFIRAKIPEDGVTTAYRCGKLIDLCTGPHVPDTSYIKAFKVLRASGSYWLGNAENDGLQRVYALAFPEPKMLKVRLQQLEEAKLRDHRTVGQRQELMFFHDLSPGSCFFLPRGARIFNRLMDFIRSEYWKRGFEEVVTPNMFNIDLWRISGHADHYLDNMFTFKIEGADFGLKPMNCPGHCLMFKHKPRTYKELPMRLADFGVLHRNEFSGALTGLTRVRRFQQDDAHIFARQDQIADEVRSALEFMDTVYRVLGFTYELDLSTRPKKAMGSKEQWDEAETRMMQALNDFGRPWKLNPGDGAFYGPKIDIKVYDAIERRHQCATIQLDFQLPIRFDLKYKASEEERSRGHPEYTRPVIVHRAILGSVERMFAVLTEHVNGKWPFWLSPRQCIVVPVSQENIEYATDVQRRIHDAGFYCDVEDSTKTLPKKIRESQLAQYNFILVVGSKESAEGSVCVRTRDNEVSETTTSVEDIIAQFHEHNRTRRGDV